MKTFRSLSSLAMSAGFLLALGCSQGQEEGQNQEQQQQAQTARLAVQQITQVTGAPVFLTSPPGDSRLFIVVQQGRILIVENGVLLETPFLDLSSSLMYGGERGLLGLAFHPNYANNGRFFVNYTGEGGHTRVAAYQVSANNRNLADPASAQVLLTIQQPAGNHNGGWLGFGPDGLLYIATGDGGGANDGFGNGQNRDSLLAKILRIDVNASGNNSLYGIPAGNPYPNAPEAWIMGLRNPWRASFDGNDLYIADVGQGIWEEVSVVTTAQAGANLGWSIMEGNHCFRAEICTQAGLVLPVYEYNREAGPDCSITGGYVYRGAAIPQLQGHYVLGDYCSGVVRSFRYANGAATDVTDWSAQLGDIGDITSFGVDAQQELYITVIDGRVYKIVPAAN